jgi:hypothetical protein
MLIYSVFDVNIISQIDVGGEVGNKLLKGLVVYYDLVIVKTNNTNVFSSSLNSVEYKITHIVWVISKNASLFHDYLLNRIRNNF